MQKPLITIAMPVYNVEKYIEQALLSALNQSYDNLEILIIDDKGTDNSMGIVNKTISSHPNGKKVRIIDHIVNQGTGATKNSAIDNATGEYLFFMDSDDYITHDCISLLFNAIHQNNAQMAIGSFTNFDNLHGSFSPTITADNCYSEKFALTKFRNYVQTWNKLYQISLLRDNNVRCIPKDTFEDIFWTFQLIDIVETVATISDITYYYRQDNISSVTRMQEGKNFIEKDFNQRYRIQNTMYNSFLEKKVKINNATVTFFMVMYHYLVNYILDSQNLNWEEKKKYLTFMDKNPIIRNPHILFISPLFIPYGYLSTLHGYRTYTTILKICRNIKHLIFRR